MDEIGTWFEVVRGILPQRYSVRVSWERRALIVIAPDEERIAWVDERDLSTLSPTRAIRLIEDRLEVPESCLAQRLAS